MVAGKARTATRTLFRVQGEYFVECLLWTSVEFTGLPSHSLPTTPSKGKQACNGRLVDCIHKSKNTDSTNLPTSLPACLPQKGELISTQLL